MEQRFGNNSIDIDVLREFCEREGEEVIYRKGDQLEREGDPARWFGFVTEGCFKYVTYGISESKMRQYKIGAAYAGEKTKEKIMSAIHKMSADLAAVSL